MRWCPKTDRVGLAGVNRDSVVCKGWRQIQHVACGQQALAIGREALEYFQRCIRYQCEIALVAHLPVPLTRSLQQEYVVGIEMRTNASTSRRITHHEIIQAGERDEVKPRQ